MIDGTKWAAAAAAIGVVLSLVTGCSGGDASGRPTLEPDAVERAVRQLVDDSTVELGGEWVVRTEPRLGSCKNERGEGEGEGVNFTYIKDRTSRGETEQDMMALEASWKRAGLHTERFSSATGDYVGITGKGDAVSSIGFQSSDLGGGDSISATSACAVGDYVDIRERQREQERKDG